MSKALFQITPLDCPGCGKKIEDRLLKQSGVISVRICPRLTSPGLIQNIWGHDPQLGPRGGA